MLATGAGAGVGWGGVGGQIDVTCGQCDGLSCLVMGRQLLTAFCGVVMRIPLTICQVLFGHYGCENEVQFSTVGETLVCWE